MATADEIVRRFAASDPIYYVQGFLSEPGDYRCQWCKGYADPPRLISAGPTASSHTYGPTATHDATCLWREAREYIEAVPNAPGPGKVRANSPDTSRAARLDAAPRSGTQRERVLRAVLEAPATDEELELRLGLTHTPRRLELVEGGWVTDSGIRRPTTRRSDAIVWQATEKARDWAARNP
jgi:hypothetical protein